MYPKQYYYSTKFGPNPSSGLAKKPKKVILALDLCMTLTFDQGQNKKNTGLMNFEVVSTLTISLPIPTVVSSRDPPF